MNESLPEIEFKDATDEELRSIILEFYQKHPEQTLKTLVCRAYGQTSKEYIALVTRGDRKVDLDKVCKIMGFKNIRLANNDEMQKLGLVAGYVSPIDCKSMKIIGDIAIEQYRSYYDGGNRELLYRRNVNYPRDFTVSKLLDIGL
jgi:prolyl-tRNA synthetase